METSTLIQSDKPASQIHPDFKDGNITLISDDNWGFKVSDFCLRAQRLVEGEAPLMASDAFYTMLNPVPSEANIRIPSTNEAVLERFVRGLTKKLKDTPMHSWHTAERALKLCRTFECAEAARRILNDAMGKLTLDDYHSALVAAFQQSDRLAIHHLLTQGYLHNTWTPPSYWCEHRQAEITDTQTDIALRSPIEWGQWESEQFGPHYWELVYAAGKASAHYKWDTDGVQSPEYWREVASHFLMCTNLR